MKKLLLPIRPKYVKQILEGTKQVEYRTWERKDPTVNNVLIYQSGDIRKIVAEFHISGIIQGTPEEVWDQTNSVGGITRKAYFKYFEGHDIAYAYRISDLDIFENPLELKDIGLNKAPMRYQYVEI